MPMVLRARAPSAITILRVILKFRGKIQRESRREFYRGHFCRGNLRFYTSVHKGRLHQQVCRAT